MNFRLPLSLLHSQDGLRLDQYFGLWAVDDVRFLQMLRHVEKMDLALHVRGGGFDGQIDQRRATARLEAVQAEPIPPPVQAASRSEETPVRDGDRIAQIAVISLRGVMTKYGSSLSTTGSTVRLRRAIRQAARSDDIDGILLHIDSPGGTAAGTADLAAEVAAANARKPVFGFAEDLTASAAYWVASQCERLFANDETALVGSIGTWVGLYDLSQMAEREGIRAVVIKAGEMKGLGFPGSAITEEQEAYLQEIVAATQAQFTQAVATGRTMSEGDVPVTGKLYMAREAQRLGLIDGIEPLDETLSRLAAAVFARRERETPNTTAESDTAPAMLKRKKDADTRAAEGGGSAARAQVKQVDEGMDQAAAPQRRIVVDAEDPETAADADPEQDTPERDTPDVDAMEPEQQTSPEADTDTTPAAPEDRIAQLERELARARAQADQAQARSAEMEADKRRASFEAFAREHRRRTLPANVERVVAVMEALAAYDAEQAAHSSDGEATAEDATPALDQFKALVAALPVQYTPDVAITGDAAPSAEADLPQVSVPEGASVDPERLAMAHRIQAYAQQHGLSYGQALARIGDEVLAGAAD